jgi:hypothetical protein
MIDTLQEEGNEKSEQWLCKWCKNEFKRWNATKCLAQVLKGTGHDIKACNCPITDAFVKLYLSLIIIKNTRKKKKK